MKILKLIGVLLVVNILAINPAHSVEIKDISTESFADLATKGDEVKFIFIFTSWCSVCKRSMPEVLDYADKYKGKPLKIIATSLDKKQGNLDKFMNKFSDKDMTIYRLENQNPQDILDAFKKVGIKYTGRIPHVTLIDSNGNIAADGGYKISSLKDAIDYLLKIR